MNTQAITLAQRAALINLCTGNTDTFLDEQAALDARAKLFARALPKVEAALPQAPVSKYEALSDIELRAELALRTCAFVSPNMTTDQVRRRLESLDVEAKVKAVKAKPNAPKTQRLGVGKRQVELLKEGKSVDEVFAIIQAEFPTAKTTKACVAWYKSKIKAGQY